MTKKFMKNRSKRQSCRQKYKVERKVREHLRKVRKEAKKNPKRKKKDPGVPNSLPFKAEILLEAQNLKQKEAEEKKLATQRKKEAKRAAKDEAKAKGEAKSLQKLVASAQFRQENFEKSASKSSTAGAAAVAPELLERSAKAFHREFAKVVSESDVILEILDARDPIGSRCRELESAVLSQPRKRLVLVLNKADLVPRPVLEAWVRHLRSRLPCVAFRCSTQAQKTRIGRCRLAAEAAASANVGSKAAGADQLMRLLANYCRNCGVKTSICVGVVGYPNTGKSSLINSLKRAKACVVGPTPGLTRCSQSVQLDKRIRLLDCPGIVLASGASDTQLILRNCVRIETVADPLPPVSAIIARCPTEQLMVFYNVGQFNDAQEFLALLAKRMGRLRKGGLPDTAAAGRKVLHDWSAGRIAYYTLPPEEADRVVVDADGEEATAGQLKLVADWSKEFELDSLELVPGERELDCRRRDALDAVVQPLEPIAMAAEDEENGEAKAEEIEEIEDDVDVEEATMETDDDEEEEEERLVVDPSEGSRSSRSGDGEAVAEAKFAAGMARLQQNRSLRRQAKRQRKKAKRLDRTAAELGGEFEAKMETVLDSLAVGEAKGNGEGYDFDRFFPKVAQP